MSFPKWTILRRSIMNNPSKVYNEQSFEGLRWEMVKDVIFESWFNRFRWSKQIWLKLIHTSKVNFRLNTTED
ncbi:MAG: hypothetical protein ACKERF_01675 [Candidatus Hodgkinia cicadicola]